MDIKNILEKLSELDAKKTLMESAPTAKVLAESTVAEPKRTSIYDVLVSELMAEADYTLPKGKFPNAVTQGNAPAAEPGAGIANPAPNLNVTAPADPAAAPAAAPAADAKPGFADRVKAGFQKIGDWHQKNSDELAKKQAADAASAPKPGVLTTSDGTPVTSSSGAPVQAGTAPAPVATSSQGERDDAAKVDAAAAPTATTSPVAQPAVSSAVTSAPAAPTTTATPPATDAPPAAPAVTANPTITPAKAPYKGSAGAQEIQKLNPAIKDVNKIQVGQELKMPDGSTYTVKPGDTLDRIAKGVKPAAPAGNVDSVKVPPAAKPAPDQIGKAPPAAPAPATKPAPAAPAAPFRKELDQKDLDRIKQLSGAPAAPAKPGKLDLSVNNPAMNPVLNAKESMERILSIIGSK